jgi:hypothetical protein
MIAIRQLAQDLRELPEGLHAQDYTKDCRKCKFVRTQPGHGIGTSLLDTPMANPP